MHYVIGDIHNNNRKFAEMLEKIGFSQEDHLYLLGDLFDRNSWEPYPYNSFDLCGCGFKSGRLGCLCLETKEETYV